MISAVDTLTKLAYPVCFLQCYIRFSKKCRLFNRVISNIIDRNVDGLGFTFYFSKKDWIDNLSSFEEHCSADFSRLNDPKKWPPLRGNSCPRLPFTEMSFVETNLYHSPSSSNLMIKIKVKTIHVRALELYIAIWDQLTFSKTIAFYSPI